jgi:hypothetical protein
MTFEDAIKSLEAEFGAQSSGQPASVKAVVCSGGIREKATDPEPALFIEREPAIIAWRDEVATWLRTQKPSAWHIVDNGIHCDKFFITVMDERKTQRLAEDRFSVSATIAVTTT